MTTNIILIGVLFIVNSVLTVFLSLKCIQLGLRWQVEVRQERPPTLDNPVTQVVNGLQEKQQEKEQTKQNNEINSLFAEYVYGAKE